MKKTIALDLDDVLANTSEYLDKYYNKRFGTNIMLQDHRSYILNNVWDCTHQEAIDIVYDFFKSDFARDITPFPGSQYAVDELLKKYDLIVLTSRVFEFRDLTTTWVNKYFSNKFKEIVITNKMANNKLPSREKYEICLEKGIETMVEDNLHYALQNSNHQIKTFLIDRPWNQDGQLPDPVKRVYSWNEIITDL